MVLSYLMLTKINYPTQCVVNGTGREVYVSVGSYLVTGIALYVQLASVKPRAYRLQRRRGHVTFYLAKFLTLCTTKGVVDY